MRSSQRGLAIIFLFLSMSIHQAAAQDSLVLRSDLRFKSVLEQRNYYSYFKDKDKAHLPYLLLAAGDTITEASVKKVTDEIAALANSLKIQGIEKKKPKRKVQEIYTFVHSTMLRKYEMICRFNEVFTTGTYNCVTATALYALVFEALQVPYEIKETPTHVYLVAYPNIENFVVETTVPLFGYVAFDNAYKQNFINVLKSSKLITDEDVTQKSLDELFNKYYFREEKITLQHLVGIHYLNDAIFRADDKDNQGAFRQAEKAWWLDPEHKTSFLMKSFGITAASEKLKPKEKAELIVKVARFKSLGISDDMIKGEFINLTQDLLFRNSNRSLYNECYSIFASGISDKELADEIAYIYYYESGRAYYNQGNLKRAKPLFQQALKLQPKNVDMNRLFLNTLGQTLRSIDDNQAVLDTLLYYKGIFPMLMEYDMFTTLMAESLLEQMEFEFENGNPAKGESQKTAFEVLLKSNPEVHANEASIGRAYSAGCLFYQRKKQLQKSREILKAGLALSPKNYLLEMRQKQIGK